MGQKPGLQDLSAIALPASTGEFNPLRVLWFSSSSLEREQHRQERLLHRTPCRPQHRLHIMWVFFCLVDKAPRRDDSSRRGTVTSRR